MIRASPEAASARFTCWTARSWRIAVSRRCGLAPRGARFERNTGGLCLPPRPPRDAWRDPRLARLSGLPRARGDRDRRRRLARRRGCRGHPGRCARLARQPANAAEHAFLAQSGQVSEIATMRAMVRTPDGDRRSLIELKGVDPA